MKVFVMALLALLATAPVLAQGGPYVEPLPTVKPAANPATADSKVTNLNLESYEALAAIMKRPGFYTVREGEAVELTTALLKDGKLDLEETDLLIELTRSTSRRVEVSRKGAIAGDPGLRLGTAILGRQILLNALCTQEEFDAHFANGEKGGWRSLISAARSHPDIEERISQLLADKIDAQWKLSNTGNAYKPTSTLIASLYNWSMAAGSADDIAAGRILAFRGGRLADILRDDKIPDFLYNWLKPKAP